MTYTEAYKLGQAAFMDGAEMSDNPFAETTKHFAFWEMGYDYEARQFETVKWFTNEA